MLPSRPMAAWLLVLAACSSQHREPKDRPVEPATAGEEIAKEEAAIVPVSPDGYVVGLHDAVALSCGSLHCCAVRANGRAVCWGYGAQGQLGNGAMDDSPVPVDVADLSNVIDISAGLASSCAVTRTRRVFCWGADMGEGSTLNGSPRNSPTPSAIDGLDEAVQVSVGMVRACARERAGSVRCWRGGDRPAALHPGVTSPAIDVDVGGLFACTVHADGWARCADMRAMDSYQGLEFANTDTVVAGDVHGCAIHRDGSVRCWGNDPQGVKGAPSAPGSARLGVRRDGPGRSLAAGVRYTCVISVSGEIQCWGEAPDTSPLPASPAWLASGEVHLCAGYESGRVMCIGRNDKGQLGTGHLPGSPD